MKDIIEYLKTKHDEFDPEYWSKENYLLGEINDFYNGDIPEHIVDCLKNDQYIDYIYENLQTHDAEKLKKKLKEVFGDKIGYFHDYDGDKKKSFYLILSDKAKTCDFVRGSGRLDTDWDNLEKFENILGFYNYYVSLHKYFNGEHRIFIEPRYSEEITADVYKNHKYIYHFTDGESAKSILENGLRTKTSKYRDFPRRIFLYVTDKKLEDDLDRVCNFIATIANRDAMYKHELAVLRIKNDGKIPLYNDTAMDCPEAAFTYVNIPKEYIKKVKTKITYKDTVVNYLR